MEKTPRSLIYVDGFSREVKLDDIQDSPEFTSLDRFDTALVIEELKRVLTEKEFDILELKYIKTDERGSTLSNRKIGDILGLNRNTITAHL